MGRQIRCILAARWACSRGAKGLAEALERAGRLGRKGSLLGNGAGFALGVSSLGKGYELLRGGKLLLGRDLADPRKPSVVVPLRLASWRACAWP